MALERNILGWQMGGVGEHLFAGGTTWLGLTVQSSGGRSGSGAKRLQLATQTATSNLYQQPARAVTGTTGTVSSGNHKRVRSRIYFRIESVSFPFMSSAIRLMGCGGQLTATGVSVWMDAQRQITIEIGNSVPANSGSGFSGSHTGPLAVGTVYRFILDVDLNVQATTVVTASVQVTTDIASPPLDSTVSTSANIGATDALGRMTLLSELVRGGFDTSGTFSFMDWVYIAASDADAVSALTLPSDTHIFGIVPPTGEVLNQWSGSFADVDEYPVDAVAAMNSSLGSGTEVQFSHGSGIALGLGGVTATKLYVNTRVSSGSGNVDMLLSGVTTTILVGVNYPDVDGSSDPVGGLLWSALTPKQFSALAFGVKKQNGTQTTLIGNIGLEVLGSAAEYGTGAQIRGETQIKAGSIYDAQIADAAGIQRHKVQGLAGGVSPVFFPEEEGRDDWMIPGPPGAPGLTRVAVTPIFFPEAEAGDSMVIPGPAGATGATGAAGSGGGGGGGGALVLLEQHDASASASLNFTTAITSAYDEYLVDFINIIPATNSVDLLCRFSTDGGATYDAGANYNWGRQFVNIAAGASAGADGAGGVTGIKIWNTDLGNTATSGLTGSMRLSDPLSATAHKRLSGEVIGKNAAGVVYSIKLSALYLSTSPVNALQFLTSSGNITSGAIRIYGVAKAASGSGAMVQLGQVITSGSQASVDFSSIPSTYNALVVQFASRDTQGGTGSVVMRVRVNNDSTAGNYTVTAYTGTQNGAAVNTTFAASANGAFCMGNPQDGNTAGVSNEGVLRIIDYARTTFFKQLHCDGSYFDATVNLTVLRFMSMWKSTAAVNRLTFFTDGTAFKDGSIFTLYGVL